MMDAMDEAQPGHREQTRLMQHYDGTSRTVTPTQRAHPFRSGMILVSRTNDKGIITHANHAFIEVSGYTRSELVGSPHRIVRHPDMPKRVFKSMWATIQSGREWRGYLKNLRKDGDHYWIYATVVPVIRNGSIIGYTSVRRTIDQETIRRCEAAYAGMRREAEGKSLPDDAKIIADMPPTDPQAVSKELHYYHKQKRTVYITGERHEIRSGVILVTQTDTEGVIIHANRSFINISGYAKEELLGMPHCIMRHPDMPARVYQNMWQTITAGKEWRGYLKNLRKDGKYYWVYANMEPVFEHGKIVGFTSARRTISPEKSEVWEGRYMKMRRQELEGS